MLGITMFKPCPPFELPVSHVSQPGVVDLSDAIRNFYGTVESGVDSGFQPVLPQATQSRKGGATQFTRTRECHCGEEPTTVAGCAKAKTRPLSHGGPPGQAPARAARTSGHCQPEEWHLPPGSESMATSSRNPAQPPGPGAATARVRAAAQAASHRASDGGMPPGATDSTLSGGSP
jgi:hypothetical protein